MRRLEGEDTEQAKAPSGRDDSIAHKKGGGSNYDRHDGERDLRPETQSTAALHRHRQVVAFRCRNTIH